MVEQVSSVIFTYYKTAEYFVPDIEKKYYHYLYPLILFPVSVISFNIYCPKEQIRGVDNVYFHTHWLG